MRAVADHRRADGIDHRQRADRDAAARHGRGGADAAFEICGGSAKPGTGAAEREFGAGQFRRLVAELAVGRIAAPVFVAAVEQVEQNRARHDRHARLADLEAAALFAQVGLHAGGGVEPEGRTARQHNGIDAFDRLRRVEQRGLARARPTAAHVHARDRGGVEHDHCGAGAELGVAGMADADAGNVGDGIADSHGRHSITPDHVPAKVPMGACMNA